MRALLSAAGDCLGGPRSRLACSHWGHCLNRLPSGSRTSAPAHSELERPRLASLPRRWIVAEQGRKSWIRASLARTWGELGGEGKWARPPGCASWAEQVRNLAPHTVCGRRTVCGPQTVCRQCAVCGRAAVRALHLLCLAMCCPAMCRVRRAQFVGSEWARCSRLSLGRRAGCTGAPIERRAAKIAARKQGESAQESERETRRGQLVARGSPVGARVGPPAARQVARVRPAVRLIASLQRGERARAEDKRASPFQPETRKRKLKAGAKLAKLVHKRDLKLTLWPVQPGSKLANFISQRATSLWAPLEGAHSKPETRLRWQPSAAADERARATSSPLWPGPSGSLDDSLFFA